MALAMDDTPPPIARVAAIHPSPSSQEVAAVVAALEVSWPRPGGSPPPAPPRRWRFSGRWWTKPVPARRDRPT